MLKTFKNSRLVELFLLVFVLRLNTDGPLFILDSYADHSELPLIVSLNLLRDEMPHHKDFDFSFFPKLTFSVSTRLRLFRATLIKL